jgi:hypothetical protein
MSVVCFLLSGPIMTAPERRKATLDRMARALVDADAIGSDQEAVRALFGNGFSTIDIAVLAGEARAMAVLAAEAS